MSFDSWPLVIIQLVWLFLHQGREEEGQLRHPVTAPFSMMWWSKPCLIVSCFGQLRF
jgi:hypothetical protein